MSSAKPKPTAADRLRRGSPAVQPAAGRAVSEDVRVKRYKTTLLLEPNLYEQLRIFAFNERTTQQAIFTALAELLLTDAAVATAVRKSVAP